MVSPVGAHPDLDHAVPIAPRVWWVGSVLPGDEFQSHAYLVEAGDQSALIDPGSVLTVDETLRKVAEVVPLEHVRWLVCHHADPDVSGALPTLAERLPHPDLCVVSEWRAFALLDHYGAGLPSYRVEDNDWSLPLGEGRELRFQLTPYLHFPGALVSYEPGTRVLFSADIFGGFVPDPTRLMMDDPDVAFEAIRPFHEHYMPSRELLAAGLRRIRQRFPDIAVIAPQHGHVLTGDLVPEMFRRLEALECGVLRFADEDIDLARLVAEADTRRQVTALLTTSAPTPDVFAAARVMLSTSHDLRRLGVAVDLPGEGWHRLDSSSGITGTRMDGPPRDEADSVVVPLPGGPPAFVVARVGSPSAAADVRDLLGDLTVSMRAAVDRLLHERTDVMERARLERQARVDPLTGALNRRGLDLARRPGPAAVLLMDLDRFKAVNDTFGHDAGDEVLRRVATAARAAVRAEDVVARIGGEEFVVLVPGADTDLGAQAAGRVRQRVAALDLGDVSPGCPTTVSIGVSVVDDAADTEAFGAAMGEADRALYAAKRAGRDRVEVCP